MFLTEEKQKEWIERKEKENGFNIKGVLIIDKGFQQISKSSLEWNTRAVLFEGVLEVVDKNLFSKCLGNGIGRGKAFGYGLLSIAAL